MHIFMVLILLKKITVIPIPDPTGKLKINILFSCGNTDLSIRYLQRNTGNYSKLYLSYTSAYLQLKSMKQWLNADILLVWQYENILTEPSEECINN